GWVVGRLAGRSERVRRGGRRQAWQRRPRRQREGYRRQHAGRAVDGDQGHGDLLRSAGAYYGTGRTARPGGHRMRRMSRGEESAPRYRMVLAKEDFKFAAAHFTLLPGGAAELLHGHNYRVRVALTGGELDGDGLLVDLERFKRALRALCRRFDG